MTTRSIIACIALLLVCPPGCIPSPRPVAPDDLPPGSQFSELGNTGQVYHLRTRRSRAEFEVSPAVAATLLPRTIRLFRFEPADSAWTELADSRFDSAGSRLIGTDLVPGYYTGFGFSANPAVAAVQRIGFDAQQGYRDRDTARIEPVGVRESIGRGPDRVGGLLSVFLASSVTEFTLCKPYCTPGLAPGTCTACHANWPLLATECPCTNADCCDCDTTYLPQYLPGSILQAGLPQPCIGARCPPCGGAFTCQNGSYLADAIIRPDLLKLDFDVLDSYPMLRHVHRDPELFPVWRELVTRTVGIQLPPPGR